MAVSADFATSQIMGNIYDHYPDRVNVGGRSYRLDTGYDNFLRAFDIDGMRDLLPDDRLELQVRLLLHKREKLPKDIATREQIVNAVYKMLPQKQKIDNEKYMDFHQDAPLIRSAFRRIGIDLTRQRIHFLEFFELLADLPSDTALMRTIDIRRRKIPKANKYNMEEIRALQEAKARVALQMTEEERREAFAVSLKKSTIMRG